MSPRTTGRGPGTAARSKTPDVLVETDGVESDFVAVPAEGEEFERIAAELPLPLPIRFMMGFPPPRQILRLDPGTWSVRVQASTNGEWTVACELPGALPASGPRGG